MTEKVYGGKKARKTKKSSACVGLSKDKCRFPCKKVKKNKDKSEFGHCQTIFSKKKKYLDAETKKVIYDGIKKGKRSEKKARRLRKKASETRKVEKDANKKAEKLEDQADKAESESKSILETVSTNLFGTSEEKVPETPAVSESEPESQSEEPSEDSTVTDTKEESAENKEESAENTEESAENTEENKEESAENTEESADAIKMEVNEVDEKKEEI
jgi:cobalamin biosynthesis protein CobT